VVQQPIMYKCALHQSDGIQKEWCMLISAIIAAAIKRDWPPRCDVSRAVGGPCAALSSARVALASPRAPCFLIFFISSAAKVEKYQAAGVGAASERGNTQGKCS
jgi:hypothetical protein